MLGQGFTMTDNYFKPNLNKTGINLPCIKCGLTHGLCICGKIRKIFKTGEFPIEDAIIIWLNDEYKKRKLWKK